MIAVDTSSLVAFFEGSDGRDIEIIEAALRASALFLPPPVLTEILSDVTITKDLTEVICNFPLLTLKDGFWLRASQLRSLVLKDRRKARLADALIAQLAIDHDVALVTRDSDFQYFSKVSALKLVQ